MVSSSAIIKKATYALESLFPEAAVGREYDILRPDEFIMIVARWCSTLNYNVQIMWNKNKPEQANVYFHAWTKIDDKSDRYQKSTSLLGVDLKNPSLQNNLRGMCDIMRSWNTDDLELAEG